MQARPRVVIFANGVFDDRSFSKDWFSGFDHVIAADGGAYHCTKMQITPDILIGDFDSLDASTLTGYEKIGVTIIRHPNRKDYTDLELALLHAKTLDASQIQILGALGARWDQSLANVLLLASPQLRDLEIEIVEPGQEIMLFHAGRHYDISGEPGDTVSLIPLDTNVEGVTTKWLEYPLSDEPLFLGATRGISNVMTDRSFSIELKAGLLLCVVTHQGNPSGSQDLPGIG